MLKVKYFVYLFLILLCSFQFKVYARCELIDLDLHDADLSATVRLLANFIHVNVIISPKVVGKVNLHLHKAVPQDAFNALLMLHGLAIWKMGNIFYVAANVELLQRNQESLKLQTVLDEQAPLKTQIWQIKYGKADKIAHLLQDGHPAFISKRGHVQVDLRTNIICIQDTLKYLEIAARLIQHLDVPSKQIVIKARIASIDSDFEKELGLNFSSEQHVSGKNRGKRVPSRNQYSLAVIKLADSTLIDVKLSALEKNGHAELISSPSLFTTNQQLASIEAGEEIPYQEVSESGGTAVAFKKAVLGLKVVPQVLPGNQVLLQLTINQDRPGHSVVQGVPTISTRQITTNVLIAAGQTAVLGGIYETNKEKDIERIPFLGHIPIIGTLLSQHNVRINKRELIIFVTPEIIF